jgi:hypothetical protein
LARYKGETMSTHLRNLAARLLEQHDHERGNGGPISEDDIELLAADLAEVEYEPRIDHCSPHAGVETIFLNRIGGLSALRRYMSTIR